MDTRLARGVRGVTRKSDEWAKNRGNLRFKTAC
jgi:hypothetical protein